MDFSNTRLEKEMRDIHPRIYLTKRRIRTLCIAKESTHSKQWQALRKMVDFRKNNYSPADMKGDFRYLGDRIPPAALCYLLSGRKEDLLVTKRYVFELTEHEHWGDDIDIEAAHLLYGLALAYDWLYDEFSEDECNIIRRKLLKQGKRMRRDCGQRYAALNNHRIVKLAALGIAGLALYPDDSAREWISDVNALMEETLSHFGDDGYSCEGISYWSYTLENMLKYFTAAEDLLGNKFLEHPWLNNAAMSAVYLALPRSSWTKDNMFINLADSPRFSWHGPHYQLYKLASLYNIAGTQWMANQIYDSGYSTKHAHWLSMLWYNPEIPVHSPSNLPLTHFFSNWDVAVMRSGWNERETITTFKCSPVAGHKAKGKSLRYYPGSGHSQPDANSFVIFSAGEWLVADTGSTLIKRTSYHNTILINGVGQKGAGNRWFDGESQYSEKVGASIIYKEYNTDYDYFVGDASEIYAKEAHLDKFLRHYLYIKPNLFVIVDELESKKNAEYDWLLHTSGQIERLSKDRLLIKNKNAFLQLAVLKPDSVIVSIDKKKIEAEYPKRDWRQLNVLTLSPSQSTKDTVFVTVMFVGDPESTPFFVEPFDNMNKLIINIHAGDFKRQIQFTGIGYQRSEPGILHSVELLD